MNVVPFDTLQFVDTLKESGMSDPQAKALSTALRSFFETADWANKWATKADVKELRQDLGKLETTLHYEVSNLRKDLHHEMRHLRKDVEAKQISMEAKQTSMEAKLDNLGLQLTIRMTGIFFSLMALFPYISKWLHLPMP